MQFLDYQGLWFSLVWLIIFSLFYLFIYLWLCWVFVSVWGLSLVVASGGHSSSWCVGLSLSRPLLLRSTGSRCAGSATVAQGPSRSAACGILPDQGSNPCPPHWQADSQPLRHQGSPFSLFINTPTRRWRTEQRSWEVHITWTSLSAKVAFVRAGPGRERKGSEWNE